MDELKPIGHDGHGAPIYVHPLPVVVHFDRLEPLINARDCELAGFDLAAVLEAGKHAAP